MNGSTFVGRLRELALLHERFEAVRQGGGRTVFFAAEAGAGKSTLVERFLAEARERVPEAVVLHAACSEQFGAGEPYQPFVEALRELVDGGGARRKKSLREIAKEIAPHWLATIPVAGNVIAAGLETVAELRGTFGAGGGSSAVAASEEALFFQYTQLLFTAASEQPVVLAIDDLHWADRATVSLLVHIARRIAARPILILGSYRPVDVDSSDHAMRDARRELERYRAAEEIALEPLDAGSLAELAESLLGGAASPELLEWAEQRAGRNALFFEELLRWLVEQRIAVEQLGEWRLSRRPRDIEVPRSVESTIEKRLSRLDEETRRTLEYASVQGNEFESVTLARQLEADELELEERLEPIARVHRLIRLLETRDLPNGDIASVYEFSHSIVQDVLHNAVVGKRRILLHRKVASILEEIHAGATHAIAPLLAVHFEEGREGARAFEFSILAAEHARRLYANWDALDHLERALRNAPSPLDQTVALEGMADVQLAVGRLAESCESYGRALAASTGAGGAPGDALRLRRKLLLAERNQGIRLATEITTAMIALCEEARALGADVEECHILWQLISLPGSSEAADVKLAEAALAIAERTGQPELIARGRGAVGMAMAFSGDPAGSIGHYEEAIRGYVELGDRGQEARCRNCLAVARVFLGDYPNAVEEFRAAVAVFDEIGDPYHAIGARNNLGALLIRLGDLDEAESTLRRALEVARRMEAPARLISPLQNLAEMFEEREEWGEARSTWEQLVACANETGYADAEVIAQCGIGTACLRLGDLEGAAEAELLARQALPRSEAGGESWARLQLFTARLAAAHGEVEGAIEILESAEVHASMQDRFDAALLRLETASVLASHAPERAGPIAEEALEIFRLMGARRMVERAQAILERTGHIPCESIELGASVA